MTPERWQKIEQLCNAALEREASQRGEFLAQACQGDDELRREVESLLKQEKPAEEFLESPALKVAAVALATMPGGDGGLSLVGREMGCYQILSLLGAGGMGEVYEARDTKLGRNVAIKVLPAAFVNDPERMSRFQREARMLAALNHPNIATIHGFEQSDGLHYLVMELVTGQTLAARLKAGPLRVEETLKVAGQLAEALEAAHEKGVIHRDLKPANVKVTPEGRMKVLDFGLAKAFAAESHMDLSQTPTLSEEGRILGTPAYMSPEQARGKAVDKRTDIWAFGCVLYELLTGRAAFRSETVQDTIAAVLEREPNWNSLPANTPQKIRDLLRRCLQKDSQRRLHDAADARIEIDEALAAPPGLSADTAAPATKSWRERFTQIAAATTTLIVIGFAIGFVLHAPKPQQPVQAIRLSAEIGADASLYTAYGPAVILAPDGTRLAFVASGADQKYRLYVRSLDQVQATALSGTEGAGDPFFSPDGQSIGFFADGKLKKISVQGGAAVELCDAPNDRGGSWGEDGTIVFTPAVGVPLAKVSSAGGTPQPLTTFDKQTGENTQRWPQLLPGGKGVLFTSSTVAVGSLEDAEIVVYSIASGHRKTVQRGGFYARYLPSGHLVYMHEGTLFAATFDLKRLEVTGQPAPVLEGVITNPIFAGAQFSFSETGNLVYVAGGSGQNVSVYWMDREGKFTPLRETPGGYSNPAFSPDGKRLAVDFNDGKRRDIWIDEWERDTLTRLTFAGEDNAFPVWTPDGQRIVYSSTEKGGVPNLWWIRADGAGDVRRLAESKSLQYAYSWRPDGKVLAFHQLAFFQVNLGTVDILTLAVEGDEKSGWKPGEPKPFVNSAFAEVEPAFSPDGRWLAYASNESGSFEVYVRPFPGPGGKWQISTGGSYPKWSRNGKELFYRTEDSKIMVVTYTASGDFFRADKPQLWSPGQFTDRGLGFYNFDLHPDGTRFAVLKAPGAKQTPAVNKVSFIFNFFDELRRKLPPGK
jgi:Tol biopolymer transport system component